MVGSERMRALAIGAWNRNYGDRAILQGMRDLFPEVDEWAPYDCQEFDSPPNEPWNVAQSEWINEEYDVVVLGGGGLIWDKPELKSISGWQWQTTVEAIEAIEVPLIVYGIGWTDFPHNDRTGDHENFVPTLRAAYDKATLFSVRNNYTRDKVRQAIGVNPEVIRDPAFGMKVDVDEEERLHFKHPPIGVCWASDKPHMRWGDEATEIEALREFVQELDRLGEPVLVIEHIEGMDGMFYTVLKTHLNAPVMRLSAFAPEVYQSGHPQPLAAVYEQCQGIYTMRKHGAVFAEKAGVPILGYPKGAVAEVSQMTEPSQEDTDDFNERIRGLLV